MPVRKNDLFVVDYHRNACSSLLHCTPVWVPFDAVASSGYAVPANPTYTRFREVDRVSPPGRKPTNTTDALPRRQHAALDLVQLDRLEQRAEVAFAEALVALALDDLEEDRADHRLRKDLQQQFALGFGAATSP